PFVPPFRIFWSSRICHLYQPGLSSGCGFPYVRLLFSAGGDFVFRRAGFPYPCGEHHPALRKSTSGPAGKHAALCEGTMSGYKDLLIRLSLCYLSYHPAFHMGKLPESRC
ncbi:MAG: hypothetical protein LIP06_07785, partial [Tannerellaceae bacterium]|nr:hypothetical protein [Tannerellaceae bacterium]